MMFYSGELNLLFIYLFSEALECLCFIYELTYTLYLFYRFNGSAGQSFGCFLTPGMNIRLVGEANDYVGKVRWH